MNIQPTIGDEGFTDLNRKNQGAGLFDNYRKVTREIIPIIVERKGGLVWHVDDPTPCKIRSMAGDIDNKAALARPREAIKPGVEKLPITKMWRYGRLRSKFPRHTILLSSGYGDGEGSDLPSKILKRLNRY